MQKIYVLKDYKKDKINIIINNNNNYDIFKVRKIKNKQTFKIKNYFPSKHKMNLPLKKYL